MGSIHVLGDLSVQLGEKDTNGNSPLAGLPVVLVFDDFFESLPEHFSEVTKELLTEFLS